MTRSQAIYFGLICLTYLGYNHVKASYKFTSLACNFVATELGRVNECEIKPIDRKRDMINIETFVTKTVTQFDIKFKISKRDSGVWQTVMSDMSVDICQFFKNPKKFFIPSIMYSFMQPYTNINHTCPYSANTAMRLSNFSPDEGGILSKFPIDQGEYGLNATWYMNKVPALYINGTLLFSKKHA